MKNTQGYIYRGDGKLTVINVPFNNIGSYTNKGNYFISPSKEDLITYFEKNYALLISNATTDEERLKYKKTLETIVNDIVNGEVVEAKLT